MRRERVHYPCVTRGGDVHRTRNGHIVNRERTSGFVIRVARRRQFQRDILVVIAVSGIDHHGLGDYLIMINLDGASVSRQRHAVYHQSCALRIGALFLFEIECDRKGGTAEVTFTLVGQA